MEYRALCRTGLLNWEWTGNPITFAVLADPAELTRWERALTSELSRTRYAGGRVEIVGDFPTDEYLTAWLDIARSVPAVEFRARTEQDDRMRRLAEPDAPDNFRWAYPDDAARYGHDTEGQAATSGNE